MKKWKNNIEISSFYTCIPQMTIIWCMIPEIWSATDIIFCHFGLFFALLPPNNLENRNLEKWNNTWRYYHFTHVHHKWKSYDAWFLRHGARQTFLLVILGHFLSFYPTNNPKKQNFEKMKKNAWRHHHFTQV